MPVESGKFQENEEFTATGEKLKSNCEIKI